MEEGEVKKLIAIILTTILSNILLTKNAVANECWRIERQLHEAEYRLRQGGNASYMKMWQKSRDHNAKELPKCLKRFGAGGPSLTVTNGQSQQNYGYGNEQLITYQTNNPQLQKIISTCNYWIQQNNQHGTENTRVMRNMACEHYNKTIREIENNKNKPTEDFIATRPLKECVKPNNKIDNDVKLCMQGLKNPDWVLVKN